MNRFARYALLSVAVATAAISAASPAAAGGGYRHHRHHDDAAALGLFGLAAGVVAGAAIASQPRYVEPDYLPPPPAYYPPRGHVYVEEYPPAPVSYAIEPWTPEWYDYCASRYRSFSPNDGTYIGYDGRAHFCVAG